MKLTPKIIKQRRAIAADVVAQIRANRYVAAIRTYVHAPMLGGLEGDLQQIIKQRVTKATPCTVCALGSAFLSAIRLFDKFELSDETRDGRVSIKLRPMRRKLREFFTPVELSAIELSFEREVTVLGDLPKSVLREWGGYAGCSTRYTGFLGFLTDEERLIWLMTAVQLLADKKITIARLAAAVGM